MVKGQIIEICTPKNSGIRSANLHITAHCNYGCGFCFSRTLYKTEMEPSEWIPIMERLKDNGFLKLNFVGGEPFLYEGLRTLCSEAKRMGFITGIVTNGSLLDEKTLEGYRGILDCIGFSVDSTSESTECRCGRGIPGTNHIEHIVELSKIAHSLGMDVKLNITIIKACLDEDFSQLIETVDPSRVKMFRVLGLDGVNDLMMDGFGITDDEYERFVSVHKDISLSNGNGIVFEDNSDMIGSYFMIDPRGMVIDNRSGSLEYRSLDDALSDVNTVMDPDVYRGRNGNHFIIVEGGE